MRHLSRLISCLALALLFIGNAAAQGYPSKAIRFIVPYAPGGGTDIVARAVGDVLGRSLGVPVVVENRPGAGGTIGIAAAASAPPDGYTMVLSGTSMVMAANLYKHLSYDAKRDLVPVSLVATQPDVLVVNPSTPARSIKDLIAQARARPGDITYSSGGIGSANHLATELFELLAGIHLRHVPYKGTEPALIDLLGGRVQMTVSVIASVLPYIKDGKLIPLAVTSTTRSPALPNVPTMAEAGVKGYDFITWYGIELPAKTPPAIVRILHQHIAQVMTSDKIRASFAKIGLDPQSSTPEAFDTFIGTELAKWAKVIKSAHITVQ